LIEKFLIGDKKMIFKNQPFLPENFVRKFKDKVDWDYISACQELSKEFIEEFRDRFV